LEGNRKALRRIVPALDAFLILPAVRLTLHILILIVLRDQHLDQAQDPDCFSHLSFFVQDFVGSSVFSRKFLLFTALVGSFCFVAAEPEALPDEADPFAAHLRCAQACKYPDTHFPALEEHLNNHHYYNALEDCCTHIVPGHSELYPHTAEVNFPLNHESPSKNPLYLLEANSFFSYFVRFCFS
jgi:hypothetical protein